MNILVVQNSSLDPIGVLGEHLIRLGATLSTWITEQQNAPPAGDYDGLVVLGGPMNAHEDREFPHLRQTVDLIRRFHREERPIIGICLGAQLIARAFGSQVYPHRAPELGFSSVYACHSPQESYQYALQESWLQDWSGPRSFMQWHFDTFELPVGATLLLTNDACENQAYRISDNVYGFQFHFEVTPEIVLSWLSMKNEWIEIHYPHLDAEIQAQVQRYAQQSARFAGAVAESWMDLVADRVEAPLLQEAA